MKKVLALILLLIYQTAFGQLQTFDIASYTVPPGWSKEVKDFAASYVRTNNTTGAWCRATIYKSIKSSGNPTVDFTSEWNTLIIKNNWGASTPPQPVTEAEDGWTSNSGVSAFKYESKDAYSMLSTISGYGLELSIVVLMNSQEHMKDVEKMLGSLQLKKPEGEIVNNAPTQENQPQPAQPIAITGAPGNQGISISTTNFDDGWVAQPFADYVRVTKNQTTVLLHYGIEITDAMRNRNNVEADLWNLVILPRYSVSNVRKYDNNGVCYFCIDFFEADAIEKSSGKSFHVGLRILKNNGVARCIEIISPSSADFQRVFPDQEKVAALTGYNKFAVAQADLIGTWEESGGSYVNMYSTVTGSYAGMNSASSADKFTFKNDGTYFSNHKGAYGMVGSMTFFDQKYNGSYTVTNWDITATKRFEGKTDVFWAEFEAVRGGRVLHLTDKTAAGMKYHLVKTE